MDWAQIISSIVGVLTILLVPVWWMVQMIIKLDRRSTILETKHENDTKKLDTISSQVSDVKDSIQIIKVAIVKIETVLESRSDDSSINVR